jgi:DNA polymerase-3 subunit gamma/tau
VRSMLGAIDQSYLYELLKALIASDATALLNIAQQMDSRSIGFESALKDLAALLHLLAIAQYSPQAIADDHPERQTLLELSSQLTAEMLQLYYQICIMGHRDIGLAPDAYAGFTMTLLRMLAFKADAMAPSSSPAGNTRTSESPTRPSAVAGGARAALAQSRQIPAVSTTEPVMQQPGISAATDAIPVTTIQANEIVVERPVIEQQPAAGQPAQAIETQEETSFQWDGNWRSLVENHLSKLGLVRALAQNCELVTYDADQMTLRIGEAHKHLASANYLEKLNGALNNHFGRRIKLHIQVGQEANTPARQLAVEKAELQDQAKDAILSDHFVQGLMQEMGATIVPNSIKPLH